MSVTVAIRGAIRCSECMGPVPMNGIAPAVLCHHCQSTVDTRAALLYLNKLFVDFWGHPSTWTQDQEGTSIDGMRFDAALRSPECNDCRTPFEPADVSAALAAGTGVTCRRCASVAAARHTDPFAQSFVPGSTVVVSEAIGTDLTAAAQPILFACLECGGKLPVDGTKRVVTCTYCKSSSFIPDALWLRMHPAAKRRWFYVVM